MLRDFLYGFDFVRMKPDDAVIKRVSPELSARALAETGKAYAIYLHVPVPEKPKNLQEHLRDDIEAQLQLALPPGLYRAEWIDTKTGETCGTATFTHAGGERELTSPRFANDLALRIVRGTP